MHPADFADHPAIRQYEEFLNHNELELACDMLESYGEKHPVSREFWLALHDVAAKMQLGDAVARYEQRSGPA
jgi:Fic family protein